MSRYYILDGTTPVMCDLLKWAEWFALSDRTVACTDLGECRVSTVFLGSDYSLNGGPPLIFETMVFGGPHDGEIDRYSTWDEANAGHAEMVARITSSECGDVS